LKICPGLKPKKTYFRHSICSWRNKQYRLFV